MALVKSRVRDDATLATQLVAVINRPECAYFFLRGDADSHDYASEEGAVSAQAVCEALMAPSAGCLEALLEACVAGALELHTEIKKSDIEIGELIGKGKAGKVRRTDLHSSGTLALTICGQVYVGKYQGRTVAIKQFNNPEKLDDREFRKELAIMSLVREPARVLPCYGGSSKKGNKFIGTCPTLSFPHNHPPCIFSGSCALL